MTKVDLRLFDVFLGILTLCMVIFGRNYKVPLIETDYPISFFDPKRDSGFVVSRELFSAYN